MAVKVNMVLFRFGCIDSVVARNLVQLCFAFLSRLAFYVLCIECY